MITKSIDIIDYSSELQPYFTELNMAWMSQFDMNKNLRNHIEDPESEIIQKGGFIFFAKSDGKIVGTTALLRESHKLYEIADMAVTPQYQGRNIGKALLKKAIDKAAQAGAKQVYLITSSKLTASIEMYKAFGFREVPVDPEMSLYEGSDVRMILNLK